jgi:hypothetical protein
VSLKVIVDVLSIVFVLLQRHVSADGKGGMESISEGNGSSPSVSSPTTSISAAHAMRSSNGELGAFWAYRKGVGKSTSLSWGGQPVQGVGVVSLSALSLSCLLAATAALGAGGMWLYVRRL